MTGSKRLADPEDVRAETLAVGDVVRATGLSPELLRAWERRYGAVEPIRTPGGSRRYRPGDVERLTQLKAAVDAGHRISEVARWSAARWVQFLDDGRPATLPAVDAILEALADLDGRRAEELLSFQLASLGPVTFAREIALPLLEAIGFLWTQRHACVASEHLGSALLRTMLGAALRQPSPAGAPRVVFTTLADERHELGALVAALVARGAGVDPLYLGPDLPAEEIAVAVERSGAVAVALGALAGDDDEWRAELTRLRTLIDARIQVWVGGPISHGSLPEGTAWITELDDFERRVSALVGAS